MFPLSCVILTHRIVILFKNGFFSIFRSTQSISTIRLYLLYTDLFVSYLVMIIYILLSSCFHNSSRYILSYQSISIHYAEDYLSWSSFHTLDTMCRPVRSSLRILCLHLLSFSLYSLHDISSWYYDPIILPWCRCDSHSSTLLDTSSCAFYNHILLVDYQSKITETNNTYFEIVQSIKYDIYSNDLP